VNGQGIDGHECLTQQCLKKNSIVPIRYHQHKPSKHTPEIHMFQFHCSQSVSHQKKHWKHIDPSKHQDTTCMQSFNCNGWLSISMQEFEGTINTRIAITHKDNHIPYEWVGIPPAICMMIEENHSKAFVDVSSYPFINFCYQNYYHSYGQRFLQSMNWFTLHRKQPLRSGKLQNK